MTQQPQKTFRDLLGRDIKVGDNVLHLWTKIDSRGYSTGGKGAVNKKLATVIKQTEKGIGIEWRDSHDKRRIKRSTIFNTRNRLIVLDGKSLKLEIDDIVKDVEESHEKYRKSMETRRKNLRHELKLVEEDRDRLYEEIKELNKAIKTLTQDSERFNILDL
jgi:chromosome segregation ATPase